MDCFDEPQEHYWEDDLYQLNQNEANDYAHELDYRDDREPEPQFELGEYRIVIEQIAETISSINDGGEFMRTLTLWSINALAEAGYEQYQAYIGEEYDDIIERRIFTLIQGALDDALNMLRSFGGRQ